MTIIHNFIVDVLDVMNQRFNILMLFCLSRNRVDAFIMQEVKFIQELFLNIYLPNIILFGAQTSTKLFLSPLITQW